MFEGGLERLEVAGITGSLGEAAGGAFDVADVFERVAKFGEEVGFGEEGIDEVESGGEGSEIAERVEDPVAELAGAHRSRSAIEDAEEGVLFSGAGFDEVEVGLGGRVDEDVVGGIADRESAEVIAVATKLVGEVMHHATSSGKGGGHAGAAEAVE